MLSSGLINLFVIFLVVFIVLSFCYLIIEIKQILDYRFGKTSKNLSTFNLYYKFGKKKRNNPINKSLEIIEGILEEDTK